MTDSHSSRFSGLAITCLVLLRISIGWHLLYEGLYKVDLARSGQPWSAASYLGNAEGPFAKLFQHLSDSAKSPTQKKFDDEVMQLRWQQDLQRFVRFYDLALSAQESAHGELAYARKQWEKQVTDNAPWLRRLQQYRHDASRNWVSLTSAERKRLEANSSALNGQLGRITTTYHLQLIRLLSAKQLQRGNWMTSAGTVGKINWLVTWGLVLSGFCLLAGLCTRIAATVAAIMLLSFYLAMPPFPGLTATSLGGGHFLYVNNNLIEALATILLAATHSGRVVGIDAVLGKVVDSWRCPLSESSNPQQKSKGSSDAFES